MERARLIAGVTLVLVIAAALIFVIVRNAGEVDEPTTAGTAEPVEDAEPSPEPTPETDEEEPVAVPTPDTTGRDFEHIFREINEFRNWLYRNPNPDLVSVIYHPDCECHEETIQQLEELDQHGYVFDDDGFVVDTVDVVEDFPSLARLEVGLHRTPQRIVDEDREVVDESDGIDELLLDVVIVDTGSGRWRVRTIRQLAN